MAAHWLLSVHVAFGVVCRQSCDHGRPIPARHPQDIEPSEALLLGEGLMNSGDSTFTRGRCFTIIPLPVIVVDEAEPGSHFSRFLP